MSLFDCIQEGIDGGEIDAERGAEAQRLFNELRADYETRVGRDAANAAAAEDVKRIMAARAGRKRRLTLLRLQAARRNTQHLENHRTLRGVADPSDAMRIFINGDEMSPIPGIVPVAKSLKGFYHAELDRVLKTFGRNIIGQTRNKAKLAETVRELFGKSTGDEAAAELASAVRGVLDRARRDFNAAGGDIGKLDNYGLPMHHNARAMRQAGYEEWRDAIWDKLDWGRITDYQTERPFAAEGAVPPPGGRAEEFLGDVYRTITTEGWSKREPSFQERGLGVSSRGSASRVLHFRDGDAWLEYNETFGSEDPFSNIITALDGYSRDTASMRVLGPNPAAGLTYLGQTIQKRAAERPWLATPEESTRAAIRATRKAKAMLDLHSGAAQEPVDTMLANFLAGTRAVLVSAQLGSAAISAVTDIGFQAAAARKIGMDPGGVVSRLGRELVGDPANAARKGLIAEQLSNVGASQARYMGEVFTPETAARVSDFVMRASGLTRWTDAGRHAFQLEFMGFLADNAGKAWDDVPEPLRMVLERKGFTAAEWDTVRATPLHEEGGATFLIPHELRHRTDLEEGRADDLAVRLMSMIHEQTEYAVPSASLEGQALFLDQTRPGTFPGELMRSGLMYKSFGMSLLYNQTRRLMSHDGTRGKLAYFGKMAALVTLMGGVSLQMKEVVKGRDPRPMDDPAFLPAAILQGGGLGIFGDFLAAEENRFGGGIAETLAGPVVGAASDLIGLGLSTAKAPFGEGNIGREATNFLRYNTPVTGIWYWGTAFQRLLFDNLQRMVDPEAERAWREAARRRVRDYGNSAWWAPGEATPSRAPDLSSALQR
ncbi:hypothetical protein ATO8_19784 [Roseivivax marinus]|uniref:Uncharacterized protein n=1 Tax=Roseivivax marinus TaxID=1379903 RepID=W4HDP3_9RHOB|nr:hypothetical protein [Roseivivax marinus]ETW10872.1 hypothetical protein ATO8_19784 [Roseivivax marinus]